MSIETTTTKDGRIYKPAVLSWKPRVRRFRLHVKAARHKHTVPAVHSAHTAATCQAEWTSPPVPPASSSAQRYRGKSQARHDSAGTGEERPPAAAGDRPAGGGVDCGSLRRAGCPVRPVLQQLSPRGVGARRCVGYYQQPGRPTGLQPQKHLQQRLLGQEDGGQHEPQVLQTAVHPHLQVSSPRFPNSAGFTSLGAPRANTSCCFDRGVIDTSPGVTVQMLTIARKRAIKADVMQLSPYGKKPLQPRS